MNYGTFVSNLKYIYVNMQFIIVNMRLILGNMQHDNAYIIISHVKRFFLHVDVM